MTNTQIPRKISEAPEGGWGYIIAASLTIALIICMGPFSIFGILFNNFLAKLGNNIEEATIVNAIFLGHFSIIGLSANLLLKKFSCRFVGLIGASFTIIGSFSTTFAKTFPQLCITYGILQGLGSGLSMHASLKCFNEYFVERKNLIMYIAQSTYAAVNIALPYMAEYFLKTFGFNGALLIISGINLHIIVVALTLHPVQWHVSQKNKEEYLEMDVTNKDTNNKFNSVTKQMNLEEKNTMVSLELLEKTVFHKDEVIPKIKFWQNIYNFFELSLLKDPLFLNIVVGLALSCTSDIMSLALLPAYLEDLQYNSGTIAYFMTIYMCADFFGRIILIGISICSTIKNRYLFLFGTLFSAIGRIVFTSLDSTLYWGHILCISFLGILRCLIEVTFILVLVEYSRTRFTAALALYQLIMCVLSISVSSLSKMVIVLFGGNIWLIHIHTFFQLVCCIFWIIELLYKNLKN